MKARHPRGLLLALIGSLALAVPGIGAAAQSDEALANALVREIEHHRAQTWHRQRVIGIRRTRTAFVERRASSLAVLRRLRDTWQTRAVRAGKRLDRPPHRAAWLCIKRHEGSWTDPNAPYYGGLQMDISFQRTYGRYLLRRKGTANRWTPAEQMWTAEKALRAGRGFYPWPNTARRCGLL
jgi:hypothetical protein